MIPVDIDNFIVTKIANYIQKGYIRFRKIIKYIPKEIGNCISLKILNISYNYIVDISPLSNCTLLQDICLDNNRIVDLSPLSKCISLKFLSAQNMKIIKYPHFNKKVITFY